MSSAIVTLAIAGLAFGAQGWRLPDLLEELPPAPARVAPTTQPSDPRPPHIPSLLRIPGQLEPRARVSIVARASLPVIELPCKQGDRVTKGDPKANVSPTILARLDATDLQAALQTAQVRRDAQAAGIEVAQVRLAAQASQLASTRLCVEEAERSWSRYQQLMASRDTSEAAADEARFRYERAKNDCQAVLHEHQAAQASLRVMQQNLKAADIEVERAKRDLAAATVTSPIDGTITRVNIQVGEVAGNPIGILMEVADMDHLVLRARIPQHLIAKLKVGQKAKVHLTGYDGQAFAGTIQSIALTATEDKYGSPCFQAEITLDPAGRPLPTGLTGEALIESSGE